MSKFLQSEHGDSSSQSTIVAVTPGDSPCLGALSSATREMKPRTFERRTVNSS